VKPQHLINYRDRLIEKENSNKTANRKLSALSSLFKEMRLEQLIPINPAESVKRVSNDIKKARTSFSDQEIGKLLALHNKDTHQGIQNKLILALLAYTGQRVSTVLGLRVKDIGKGESGLTVLSLRIKGGKLRRLPIGYEPARLLEKQLRYKTSPGDFIFSPLRGPRSGDNKAIASVSVFRLIKRSLKAIKARDNKSAHGFRRSVLTKLLNTKGISAEQVREEVSFHSSLDTLALYKMPSESRLTENPILSLRYSQK
jgi:integrase